MPRTPQELPPALGAVFNVRDAVGAGVSHDRLRARDLVRPFHGVRATSPPVGTEAVCRAYGARMRDGDVFSHVTAAMLWRMPLPMLLAPTLVHVTSPVGVRAARGRGVRGHTHPLVSEDVRVVGGLRVTSPEVTWTHLSTILPWWDLAAVGDFIVTGLPFESVLPLASRDDLVRAHERAASPAGAVARRRALEHIVVGPLSRPESLSLVLFRLAGLPDPAINEPVDDARGSFVALPDAFWREFRVAYEYEGDHHRRVERYRRDVRRTERLADEGWVVVRATADDLYGRPAELVGRVARRLRARGWLGHPRRLPRIGPIER